ncbi:UNVERIFIED_CONTAM: hypothetical protein PYX00_006452 [Menopon gallinae]|uniref:Triokinase/FMN cyclase n=1 Tax=Menopon gallinae TaxID=328185 RepID=A0AAW2HWW8_9NEOP
MSTISALSKKEKSLCTKTKSFIYNKETVYQSLLGTCFLYNDLVLLKDYNILLRKDHNTMVGKVKILAGGGAGLEPAEAGYVGQGMLTGVVLGNVLTAPPANSILVAIRELANENKDGVLLLVKNCIGDVLNFGLAFEQAVSEDITIKMLLIGDDCPSEEPRKYGRRGTAGSVLVYKIAGALAEKGKSLDDIVSVCKEKVLPSLSTISMCSIPSKQLLWYGPEERAEEKTEAMFGIGIYGEPGIHAKYESSKGAVTYMINLFENFEKSERISDHNNQAQIVLMINNLGAVPKIEENTLCADVYTEVAARNYSILRMYAGTFMSLLDSNGFSLTVLRITDAEILRLLDFPTAASNWTRSNIVKEIPKELVPESTSPIIPPVLDHDALDNEKYKNMSFGPSITDGEKQILRQIISFAAEALISCEKHINVIDMEVGDGDTGTMLKNGAEVINNALENDEINLSHPYKTLQEIAQIINKTVGGTIGALYFVFFNAASKAFLKAESVGREAWCEAFRLGVRGIRCYGKAEVGERTMLDVLQPALEVFEKSIAKDNDIRRIASSITCTVEYYAEETRKIKPYIVRGRYPKNSLFYPDAGAHAVAVWIRAVSEGVKLNYPE